jgi:hypothetical protein
VNETLARRYWGGRGAIGKEIRLGRNSENTPWHVVVGIVGDVHHFGLGTDAKPTVYVPFLQMPSPYQQLLGRTTAVMIRVTSAAADLAISVRMALSDLDPNAIAESRPMNEIISESIAPQRLSALVVTVFAAVMLWLTAVGLYAVMTAVVRSS